MSGKSASKSFYDLHHALVAACQLGCEAYFAEYRPRLPKIEFLEEEHFLFVYIAHLLRLRTDDYTFRMNLAKYAIDPQVITNPKLESSSSLLGLADQLPDTLVKTVVPSWIDKNESEIDSSDLTLAHFLHGLIIFVRWHNSCAFPPQLASESLAARDPIDLEFDPEERAILYAVHATHVGGQVWGDFERYVYRSAWKDMNIGALVSAKDKLDFLIGLQNRWSERYPDGAYPKLLVARAVLAADDGDPQCARQCCNALPEFIKVRREVQRFLDRLHD